MNRILTIIFLGLLIVSCFDNNIEKKGFQVNEITENEDGQKVVGLQIDSFKFETRPRNVLLTFNSEHRLTPIYKVNYDKKNNESFTGSNEYHSSLVDEYEKGNKDGFINVKDLRRFYFFDINGMNKKLLIPKNYSVMSSEYDSANDLMYVFAKLDKNQNGQMESDEPTDIYWIDLTNPDNVGQQFKTE